MSKRKDKGDNVKKKSKWKLRSPLPKRKLRVDNSQETEQRNQSQEITARKKSVDSNRNEEDIIVDDVFSPVALDEEKALQSVPDGENENINHTSTCDDELPSIFDRVDSNTPLSRENRSISHEIRDIIDSLGNVEDKYASKYEPPVGK